MDSDEHLGQSTANLPVLPPADLEDQIPLAVPLGETQSAFVADSQDAIPTLALAQPQPAKAKAKTTTATTETTEKAHQKRPAEKAKQKPTTEQGANGTQSYRTKGTNQTAAQKPASASKKRRAHEAQGTKPSQPAPQRKTNSAVSKPRPKNKLQRKPNKQSSRPKPEILLSTPGQSLDRAPLDEIDTQPWTHGMPSWLVSFIFHLVVLLLLAIFTIGGDTGLDIIGLEIAASDDNTEVISIEPMEFNEVDMTDPLASSSPEIDHDFDFDDSDETAQQIVQDLNQMLAKPAEETSSAANELAEVAKGDGKSVTFFGAGAQGTKFVFVIDCSGSMFDEDRWYYAKRELKRAIDSLTNKQEYYVFLYNFDSFPMTVGKPKLVAASRKNRRATNDWLEMNAPYGDTRPLKSMEQALGLQPDAIFLLSDGELKDNTAWYLASNNQTTGPTGDARAKIPVHTIFLGSGFGEALMRQIAQQNDGTFTRVRN